MNQNSINLNLEELLQVFLDSKPYTSKTSELEVRFSGEREVHQGRYKKYTIGQKYTKVDYDNVIQKLLSFKFKPENPQGSDIMRIYIDNMRVELNGINSIQNYCINENIDKLINDFPNSVEFQKKKPATIIQEGTEPLIIKPVENNEYNLKYVYSIEQIFSTTSDQVRTILSQWDNKQKFFRYINRLTLTHPDFPIKVDMSIIKSSNPKNKSYTLNESQLFKKHEKYEIELEIDNSKIKESTTVDELSMKIKKVIKYVLMGLQLTNYPVSFTQLTSVSKNYLEMIFGKEVLVHARHIARMITGHRAMVPTPPHQDFPLIQGTSNTWTAWIPLGDCPRSLGGLTVLRGTHKFGYVPIQPAKGAGSIAAQTCPWETDWVEVEYEAGDVLTFPSFTIHKGLRCQQKEMIRLSLDVRYQPVDEPIELGSLNPHTELSWEEIYAGWQRDDLKYYWKKHELELTSKEEKYLQPSRRIC